MCLMPFAGLLALITILGQDPARPADYAAHSETASRAEVSQWEGGEVQRCPENLRLEGSNRPLIEVPDTPIRLADKTGGMPGWVPPHQAWPVPCVSPAGR